MRHTAAIVSLCFIESIKCPRSWSQKSKTKNTLRSVTPPSTGVSCSTYSSLRSPTTTSRRWIMLGCAKCRSASISRIAVTGNWAASAWTIRNPNHIPPRAIRCAKLRASTPQFPCFLYFVLGIPSHTCLLRLIQSTAHGWRPHLDQPLVCADTCVWSHTFRGPQQLGKLRP